MTSLCPDVCVECVYRHTVSLGVGLRVMILGGVFAMCVCDGGVGSGGQSEETAERLHPPGDASVG